MTAEEHPRATEEKHPRTRETPEGGHGGRASSWLAVTVVLLGFAIAGIALCLGPNWPVLWMGVGVCAMGGVLTLVFNVFSDVVVDAPRTNTGEDRRGESVLD
ncbi:HGxxPAAW family protein [Streptosporangium sp. NPDC023615]|uniref:HGxxPAAW family protein n=1 Tax=Streptosporangium sp. NPDC023615 TaxID=3154794 RepID=UPI0034138529